MILEIRNPTIVVISHCTHHSEPTIYPALIDCWISTKFRAIVNNNIIATFCMITILHRLNNHTKQ